MKIFLYAMRQSMYYRYWPHHAVRPAHLGIRNRYQYPQYRNVIAQMKKELLRLQEEVGDSSSCYRK
ncbi:MAG: hypothetical protein LBG45_11005 [Dysgonamonadaceae bacterium]|jgi:hypothetical protein|nr:hypothetical protein [Dysgonamonadaceae bacterium]